MIKNDDKKRKIGHQPLFQRYNSLLKRKFVEMRPPTPKKQTIFTNKLLNKQQLVFSTSWQ